MPPSSDFPSRVVSLAPSATEVVCALGCGDRLVGRTAFCDFPPETGRVPVVGGWINANVDAVVAREPDLVLTSTFLQDAMVVQLRARGIPVCHTDPRTFADVLDSCETIAGTLGVPDRGKELRSRMESELRTQSPGLQSPVPRVYAEEWPEPPMASGNWVPDLVRCAGGTTLLASGERSRTVSLAEVRAFDPDLIVLNYCGMELMPSDAQVARVTGRAGWDTLRAVRARRVFAVQDSLLNRPGPRLAEGARHLQRILAHARAEAAAPPPAA